MAGAGTTPPIQPREERYVKGAPEDYRRRAARDRDRILYSREFSRLAGVTQVASPLEGHVFHTRLLHSLKVAQVARRCAEYLRLLHAPEAEESGLDPDVVEAAALAHDLGHPPFGHTGEQVLCGLLREEGVEDGFEGNAQSFRIVTRLSARKDPDRLQGLNLTRGTLDGLLKYPWFHDEDDPEAGRKWGVYRTEESFFNWVRQPVPDGRARSPSVEAEIMDYADDVTYAVHDLEDFYRAGLIPLDRLCRNPDEVERFIDQANLRRAAEGRPFESDVDDLERLLKRLLHRLAPAALLEPFQPTRKAVGALQSFSSELIGQLLPTPDNEDVVKLRSEPGAGDSWLEIDPERLIEVEALKELTAHYVFKYPPLASQKVGQRATIEAVLEFLMTTPDDESGVALSAFPPYYRAHFEAQPTASARARVVADAISGMTEPALLAFRERIQGYSPGSIFDVAVR